jgi:hypothetical protein
MLMEQFWLELPSHWVEQAVLLVPHHSMVMDQTLMVLQVLDLELHSLKRVQDQLSIIQTVY